MSKFVNPNAEDGNIGMADTRGAYIEDKCWLHGAPQRSFRVNGRQWIAHRLADGSWCNNGTMVDANVYAKWDNLSGEIEIRVRR